MVRRENRNTTFSLFFVLLLLYPGVNIFSIPVCFSYSFISLNSSLAQDYIIHDRIRVHNDSELATIANSGTGTVHDPYIVSGWNITVDVMVDGIFITGTTKYFRIENCWIKGPPPYDFGAYSGIDIQNVVSGTATIVNNNICTSGYGIFLWETHSATVAHNICNNNLYTGIFIDHSNSSTITNNACTNNSGSGIYLRDSDNNSVIWNIQVENGNYGIALVEGSDNNLIHHNNFKENGQKISQGCDFGTNNHWYDETTMEGNYWSDYNGKGTYSIAGSAGTVDPFPLSYPCKYGEATDTERFFFWARIGLFLVIVGILAALIIIGKNK